MANKKQKLLAIGCLALLPWQALASQGAYLGVFYESIYTDSKKEDSAEFDYLDKGKGPGFELTSLFSPSWGARLEWAKQDYTRTSTLASGGDDYRLGLDLLYRFTEENYFYTFAGLKSITPADGHAVANLGLGLSLPFFQRWAIFAEGAAYQGITTSFTDWGIKAGVRYKFYTSEKSFIEPNKLIRTAVVAQPKPPVIEPEERIIEQVLLSIRVNVLFPNDSSYIHPRYYPEIKKVADFMNKNPGSAVRIEGHTSEPASVEYNLRLSAARAKAVVNLLVKEYKIDPELISSEGYGKSRLLDLANNEAAHTKNRRIEAIIYAVETQETLLNPAKP